MFIETKVTLLVLFYMSHKICPKSHIIIFNHPFKKNPYFFRTYELYIMKVFFYSESKNINLMS